MAKYLRLKTKIKSIINENNIEYFRNLIRFQI